MKLSSTYETNRAKELEQFIEVIKETTVNTQNFLKLVRRYTDIEKLDAEIIRTFIKRVNVYKAEKIYSRRT